MRACDICGEPFVKQKRTSRFCSPECHNQSQFKITRERLMPYVESGSRTIPMALALGVNRRTVLNALHRHELYHRWYRNRFYGTGSVSATTACEAQTGNSPSAKLAAGMSYGA